MSRVSSAARRSWRYRMVLILGAVVCAGVCAVLVVSLVADGDRGDGVSPCDSCDPPCGVEPDLEPDVETERTATPETDSNTESDGEKERIRRRLLGPHTKGVVLHRLEDGRYVLGDLSEDGTLTVMRVVKMGISYSGPPFAAEGAVKQVCWPKNVDEDG